MSFLSASTATPNAEYAPTSSWQSQSPSTSVDRTGDRTSPSDVDTWFRNPHDSFQTPTCRSRFQDTQLNGSVLPTIPQSDHHFHRCDDSVVPDGGGLLSLSSIGSTRPTRTRKGNSTKPKSSVTKYRPNKGRTMTKEAREKKRARDQIYNKKRKDRTTSKLAPLYERIATLEREEKEAASVISSLTAEGERMMSFNSDLSSRCDRLQAENNSLRDTIEFYGSNCSNFIHQMMTLSNGFVDAIQKNDEYNAWRIRELELQISGCRGDPSFSLNTNQVDEVSKRERTDNGIWLSGTS